jgi:putative phosphoserine phosphatase/1-acylglycerol-3-phosphate O-acyltransferase
MSAAAFFDIDGTLLAPPSLERRLLRFLRWRSEIGVRHVARAAEGFVSRVWRDPLLATHGNKLYLRGTSGRSLRAGLAFLRRFPLPIFPAAVERAAWHAAAGHRIVLVSGTLQPLGEVVAEGLRRLLHPRLGSFLRVDVIATRLEIRDGLLTGCVFGRDVCGPEKARAMERLAIAQDIDLAQSFAYGDGCLDRWMLSRVAHPIAVNPSFLLRRYARRRGWPVLHWAGPMPASHAASPLARTLDECKSQ